MADINALIANPQLPQINLGAAAQGAGQIMQVRQQQQQMQQVNALRGVLSDPDAIDPETKQLTSDAMRKVMGIDPNVGMKLQQNALVDQERQMRVKALQTKSAYDQADYVNGSIYAPVLEQYEGDVRAGKKSEAQAAHDAQEALTKSIGDAKTGGVLPPEVIKHLPTKWDYGDVKRRASTTSQYMDWWKAQNQEDKDKEQGWAVQVDTGTLDANGQPTQFRYNPRTAQSTTLDGKQPYTPKTIAKPEGVTPAAKAESDAEAVARQNIADAEQQRGTPLSEAEKAVFRQQARLAPKLSSSPAGAKEADAEALAMQKFRDAHGGRDPVKNDPKDKTELASLTTAERQKATAMSGRNAVMVARGLTSAADAVSDIRNVVELPITIDRGIFGGRHQGPGLLAATKEILANEVTAEDAQAYNTAMAGLERSLGGLATGGLAVSDNVMNQFGKLMIVKGDTNLIKLRKIATMRQNVENGLDGLLTNPQLGGEQSKLIERLQNEVREAVPFTVHDVNQVEFGKDKNLTVGQFAKKHGVAKEDGSKRDAAPSTDQPTQPAGQQGQSEPWKPGMPIPAGALADLKAEPKHAAAFDKVFGQGEAAKVLGPAQAAPSAAPAPSAPPAAPAPAQPAAGSDTPIPLKAGMKQDDMIDKQVYETGRGLARWDKARKKFFLVGGQ